MLGQIIGAPVLKRKNTYTLLLLMVQKPGDHQLRSVVYPIIYRVFYHPWWLAGFREQNPSVIRSFGGEKTMLAKLWGLLCIV